jgi:PAS domain S-box-containing protein
MQPDRTALLLIGYQNDYFASDGVLHDAVEDPERFSEVLRNTLHLLDALIGSASLVISTPIAFTADYSELLDPVGILRTVKDKGAFQSGRRGAEVIPELRRYGARILEIPGKRGLNAFADTDLDQVLRAHRIETVAIAGVLTSVCVDSTGRSAVEHGYKATILADCTFGRTDFEQEFYCEKVFPIYAEVMDHRRFLERCRRHRGGVPRGIDEEEVEIGIQQRLFEELSLAERRYRELVENLRNIVFKCDRKGTLTFVNPAWADSLGYGLSDSVGRPFMDFVYAGDKPCGWRALFREAVQQPRRLRLFHAEGRVLWFELTVRTGEDGGGVGLLYDIDRQQEKEQELLDAMAATEAATQAKSRFLAIMSHEIRTPMNGVIGTAELLLHSSLDARQRRYAQTIHRSGNALLAILDDILDYSKIESGNMGLEIRPMNPRTLAEEVRELFLPKARDKGLDLTVWIDPEVPTVVMADLARLRQVLINLVDNAVKFTQEGGIALRISPSAPDDRPGHLELAVQDSGIGVPADRQRHIFEPFAQSDASTARRYGGTGLGLAISARLVELMGGVLQVESGDGEGAVFRFSIPSPAAEGMVQDADEAPGDVPLLDPGLAQRLPLDILVAEDDATSQELLLDMLRCLGYRPDVAGDGAQAVERAAGCDYDLILMDLWMPELDGLRATQEILRQARGQRPVIVAVTANVLSQERDRCIAAGMSDILRKPVELGSLQRIIRQMSCARRDGVRR